MTRDGAFVSLAYHISGTPCSKIPKSPKIPRLAAKSIDPKSHRSNSRLRRRQVESSEAEGWIDSTHRYHRAVLFYGVSRTRPLHTLVAPYRSPLSLRL